MDSFIFLPVENGKLKDSSFTTDRVKKGEEEESVGFEQLLSPFLFSWGAGEVTPVKSCSSSSPVSNCSLERSTCSTCSPCSTSGADTFSSGACSLSSSSSLEELLNVEGWQKTIDSFLSEVENISFTLNLGEKGKVSVLGGTGEDGKFTFQISGDKEALSELLGKIVEQVVAFLEEKGFSYPLEGDSASRCSLGQSCGGCCSGGEVAIPQEMEITSNSSEETRWEYLIPDDLPLPEEGENTTTTTSSSDISSLPDSEVEEQEIILPEIEGEEVIVSSVTPELKEDNSLEEVATSQKMEITSNSSEEALKETETTKAYASSEVNLFSSGKVEEGTPKERKVEMVIDLGGMIGRGENTSTTKEVSFSPVEDNDLSKVFDRILQTVSQNSGEKEVVIQLKPESLGSIVLQVREENNRVECVWQIADPRTQEIVAKNLPVLEAHMSEQGLWLNNYLSQNGQSFSYFGRPHYSSPSFATGEEDAVNMSEEDGSLGKVNILV